MIKQTFGISSRSKLSPFIHWCFVYKQRWNDCLCLLFVYKFFKNSIHKHWYQVLKPSCPKCWHHYIWCESAGDPAMVPLMRDKSVTSVWARQLQTLWWYNNKLLHQWTGKNGWPHIMFFCFCWVYHHFSSITVVKAWWVILCLWV